MTWIFYSLIAASVWALVNHIDKYLLEKYCKDTNAGALVLFSSLIGIPVVFVLALFIPDIFAISIKDVAILIFTGVIYVFAIVAYLYALDSDETSTVAPQMIVTPVLSAILSYFILREVLTINQIIAIIVILGASLGLSINFTEMKINMKAFGLMLVFSLLVALNAVLFKLMSEEAGFWLSALWTHVGFIISGVFFFLYTPYRKAFITMISSNGTGILSVNIGSELITIVANLIFYWATLLGPIALVQTFTEGIQPVFVFIYGIIFTILFPSFAQENLTKSNIFKKTVFISIMIVGMYFAG